MYPKPSAHDVVTGFFIWNTYDMRMKATNNFATTIGIMAQDSKNGQTYECMKGAGKETKSALKRMETYVYLLIYFGEVDTESNQSGCAETMLDYGGAGTVPSYWDRHSEKNKCKLVSYETLFSVYNREDYKRCVCWHWGNGEEDCPQSMTYFCSWQGDP